MIKMILLIIAVSLDCLAASIGIGSAGIKVPARSAAVISFTGSLFLTLSAAFGDVIKRFVPERLCGWVSFGLLVSMGVFELFHGYFGKLVKRNRKNKSEKPAVTELFFDGTAADSDNSKSISVREAVALSVALSADSLVTGVSAGLGRINLPLLSIGTFGAGLVAIAAGQCIGRKIVSTFNIDLGWICGAVLIVLAFFRG